VPVVFSDDFTGTDGAVWDAAKWTLDVGTSAVADISTNRGRLHFDDVAGARARADARQSAVLTDQEVLLSYQWGDNTTLGRLDVFLRSSGDWGTQAVPTNCYFIELANNSTAGDLKKCVANVVSTLQTVAVTQTASTVKQWLRLRIVSNRLTARIWDDGSAEPGGWEFDQTDTDLSSGILQIRWVRSSTNVGAKDVYIDDLALDDMAEHSAYQAAIPPPLLYYLLTRASAPPPSVAAQQYTQPLTATLGFTPGGQQVTSNHQLAQLPSTASLASQVVHHFTQALSATISFTAALARGGRTSLTASLSFTGALPRLTRDYKTATVGFTSALPRTVSTHLLVATLSLIGALARRTTRVLAAAISFVGALSTQAVHVFTQALSATVGLTGALGRRIARAMPATLGTVGTLARRARSTVTAVLGLSGAQVRRTASRQAATLDLAGTVTRRLARLLSAAVSATGSLAVQAGHLFVKALTASVGFAASVAGVQPPSWTAGIFDSGSAVAGEREGVSSTGMFDAGTTVVGEREPGSSSAYGTDQGPGGIGGTG